MNFILCFAFLLFLRILWKGHFAEPLESSITPALTQPIHENVVWLPFLDFLPRDLIFLPRAWILLEGNLSISPRKFVTKRTETLCNE
jgi:hypothetical protein